MKGSRSHLAPHSTWFFVCLLLFGSRAAAAVDVVPVTTCGQSITAGRVAALAADLDCSSSATPFIELGHRVTLQLAGHVLTGTANCTPSCLIECTKSCRIEGPGTIAQGAIRAQWNAKITGATIVGSVFSLWRGVRITDSTIIGVTAGNGAGGAGVAAHGGAKIVNSTITGHVQEGVSADKAVVWNSAITDNGEDGISVLRAKVIGSTVTGNDGFGIVGSFYYVRSKVIGSTVAGNVLSGIDAPGASIKDSVITNNGGDGVALWDVGGAIKNSTITGNGGFGVHCLSRHVRIVGTSAIENNCTTLSLCADVGAHNRPVVRPPATCGTSWDFRGSSWGVCSLD